LRDSLPTNDGGVSLGAVPFGVWSGDPSTATDDDPSIRELLGALDRPVFAIAGQDGVRFTSAGSAHVPAAGQDGEPLAGLAYPCLPEALGDRRFCRDHGLGFPYMAGAMANGIGSEAVVEAMAGAGMLGSFGAAGLSVARVREAVDRIQQHVGDGPYAFNLIHSPNEAALEEALVDLYIEHGVHRIEASAFLQLTPAVVRYRLHGIHRGPDGRIVTPNRIIAKVSREEIAEKFFSPAPEKLVRALVERGAITHEQAELAEQIPVAQDITAEADSGGHTDHRPAIALLPTLAALRDTLQERFGYAAPLRVGLAGGISTPASAAAAFAMGAAYIVTGSVNQACVEAGTSDLVREMLAETRQADVTRAPAADMFEMGVTVQVLKRGTMFAMRGGKLYELYRAYESLEAIPAAERAKLETTVFRASLDEVWAQTRAYFEQNDPRQIERAEKNAKHRMALVFRWYLGQSSNWANRGMADRTVDYQVWCGPAMGAFNEWVRGSAFEQASDRRVASVARNLLYGAAVTQRVQALRAQGVALSNAAARIRPKSDAELEPYFPTKRTATVSHA